MRVQGSLAFAQNVSFVVLHLRQPRLAHRHHYRGELWYVLEDHASARFGRFTPSAYQIIGLMDGKRTVQEIWDTVRDRLKEETPTQEEVVRDVMLGKSRIKEMMDPIEVANLFVYGFSRYAKYLIGGDLLFDGGVVLTY